MAHFLRQEDFEVSDDPARLDIGVIHEFLAASNWAECIPRGIVERSVANSICIGAYTGARQIGFARVISDRATYAYVADVFVLEPFRRRGIGKLMMQCIMTHPELQGLRRWSLLTRDAHALYRPFGFIEPKHPELNMEISNSGIYTMKKGKEKEGNG